MTTQAAYISGEWFGNATASIPGSAIGGCVSNNLSWSGDYQPWYPYYTPTYYWPYTVTQKIRLTLTEVEHLRKICLSDKRLRETMQKMAPAIEVEIDFPGGE